VQRRYANPQGDGSMPRFKKIAKGIGYGALMTVAGTSTIITGTITAALLPAILALIPIPLVALTAWLTNVGWEGTIEAKKRMDEQFNFSTKEMVPAASIVVATIGSNAAELLAQNALASEKPRKTELSATPPELFSTTRSIDDSLVVTNSSINAIDEINNPGIDPEQHYFEAQEESDELRFVLH